MELLGGRGSAKFKEFREMCCECFLHLREHHHRIILLLEMFSKGNEHLPCFAGNSNQVLEDMRKRFLGDNSTTEATEIMNSLIDDAVGHWTTILYDQYQEKYVGI